MAVLGAGGNQQLNGLGSQQFQQPNNGFQQQQQDNNGQPIYNSNGAAVLLQLINQLSNAGNSSNNNNNNNNNATPYSFTAFTTHTQNTGPLASITESFKVNTNDDFLSKTISDATVLAAVLTERCLRREKQFIDMCKYEIEHFRNPNIDNPSIAPPTREDIFEQYLREVEFNEAFFKYILSFTGFYFAGKLVSAVRNNNPGWNPEADFILFLFRTSFYDCMCLCFTGWLETHSNAAVLYGNSSPRAKQFICNIDNGIENCRNIFNELKYAQFAGLDLPFPWRGGLVARIEEHFNKTKNTYTYVDAYAQGGDYYRSFDNLSGTSSVPEPQGINTERTSTPRTCRDMSDREWNAWLKSIGAKGIYEDVEREHKQPDLVNPTLTATVPYLEELGGITVDNWRSINLNIYFKEIPNYDTNKRICDPKVLQYFSKVWHGPSFSSALANVTGVVALVSLDYNRGSYTYEFIGIGDNPVNKILTNPDLVLPYLYQDNDGNAKSTFNKKMVSLDEFKDESGKACKISEVVKLGEEPDIVYGNKPLTVTDNNKIFSTFDYIKEKHDPENKLDAVVIPCKINFDLKLESHIKATQVLRALPMLSIESPETDLNIVEFLESVRIPLDCINSPVLTQTVTHILTNTINRWLVECKMFPESNKERGHISCTNIFADIKDIINELKDRGEQVAAAELLEFQRIPFIVSGFKCLLSYNDTLDGQMRALKAYEGADLEIMEELYYHTLVITRYAAVAKLNKMPKINGDGQAIFPKSTVPALHYLYHAAREKFKKHFQGDIPLLLCFNGDREKALYYCTLSANDPNVLSVRYMANRYPLPLMTPNNPYG